MVGPPSPLQERLGRVASLLERSGRVPPRPYPWTLDLETPLLVTSGGDHLRPVHLGPPSPSECHLVMATETKACIVSKWAVLILPECFLVFKKNSTVKGRWLPDRVLLELGTKDLIVKGGNRQ